MLHAVSAPSSTTVDTEHKPCICIFSALYEPHIGGVESYTKGIAEALVAKGQRVIVVTMNTNNAAPKETSNGIEIIRLPCRPFLNGRFPLPLNNNKADKLWNWLEQQQIDNVVINTRFYCLSTQGAHFARGHGIAPILIEHGSAHLTLGNPALDIIQPALRYPEKQAHGFPISELLHKEKSQMPLTQMLLSTKQAIEISGVSSVFRKVLF